MKSSRLSLLIVMIIAAGFLTGCASTIAKMSVDGMKPIMVEMRNATNKNQDPVMVGEAMPMILVQMDGFIMVSPENRYMLTSAAEVNMGYAFLFVEDVDKKRAGLLYLKARDYALRALSLNNTFKQALMQDDLDVFTSALKTIHKRDVAPLFLATNSWLSWINAVHGERSEVLNDLPRIEAMMDRIMLLDDTHYYGGIHALTGVYAIQRPEMFGGRPDEAEAEFKEAFEISESKFLLWKYLYARYYAVQKKDRELFVSTLKEIIESPDDLLPNEAFVNNAVRKKAATLLLKVDEYFQ